MRLLRVFLMFGAMGWGICILGVFLPWDIIVKGLYGMGAENIVYDPMLNYWFRMVCGGFSALGCIFAVSAYKPEKYWVLIPLLGWLSIAEGIIIGVHGLRLGLPAFPFYGDTAFCLLTGAGIVVFHRKINKSAIREC